MFDLIDDQDLASCIDFIIKIDALKGVLRKTSPIGLQRPENTAEHCWHLMMMAMVFQRYANEPVDLEKVLKMLALHDLGEIAVNDVFLYDAARSEAAVQERAAIETLFANLPSDLTAEFTMLWQEFAEGQSPEARYARALDRFQPFLSNLSNGGGSWKTMGITKDQALDKNRHIGEGTAKLWEVYQRLAEEGDRQRFFSMMEPGKS